MNKKTDLKLIIFAIINLTLCLSLIIFASPNQVPLFFNFKENISVLCSKWFFLTCAVVPTILCILIITIKNKPNLTFFFKMLFYICLFENMLIMIVISLTDSFILNTTTEIPMSIVYFLPLSACMTIGSIKIKHLPFKSFSPFKNKYSVSSEFIWKQTHIFAKDILFKFGVLSVFATLIFSIFRLLIVNLFFIAIVILIIYILVIRESKLMYKKHSDMKQKKDNLSK